MHIPFVPPGVRGRVVSMYALLIGVNAVAWIWALIAFHHYPVLLGTALLAYTFGLRHAVDANHIAAIDNAFPFSGISPATAAAAARCPRHSHSPVPSDTGGR